jgi:hypothetical protein
LSTRFPADGIEWSKHGLSHSYVKGGIGLRVAADPAKGFILKATTAADKKTVTRCSNCCPSSTPTRARRPRP